MDDDENIHLIEMDTEGDTDKKTRRSSILKPQKPRNPLSILDFSEANPDNTLGRATRRVSFASSNFVKPFAADPEKNTIWDNTYEEEVNHTDSTKSSYEQTHGTKSSDFLNTTSVYSASTDLHQSDKIPVNFMSLTTECANVDSKKVQVVNEVISSGESLVSLARKLRSKSVERYDTETMDFTLVNKTETEFPASNETEKENVKLQENIPLFHKVRNISCSTTKLTENTMEMTCITDKENVNPLINDLSLVIPVRNLGGTNVAKCSTEEDVDYTISSGKTVYFNRDENDLDFTGLNAIDKNIYTKEFLSNVEFMFVATEKSNREMQNENELDRFGANNASDDVKMNTVYFNDSANDMELTEEDKSGEAELFSNKSRRKTILFSEMEGEMDFTVENNETVNDNIEIKAKTKYEGELKNKTIFDKSGSDMEFTTTLPAKIYNNSINNVRLQKHQETIRFDGSAEEMEFTGTFQTQKNNVKEPKSNTDLKETVCFEKSQCNMEFAATLVGKINNALDSTSYQEDSMEITAALSTEPIENKPVEKEKDKTKFESQMELTSILQINASKSLIQNHPMVDVGSNIPVLLKNNNSDMISKKKINFDVENVNSNSVNANESTLLDESDENKCSNSSLNVNNKLAFVNDSDMHTNISNSSSRNEFLTLENSRQIRSSDTMDHLVTENDISFHVSKGAHDIKRHISDSVDEDTIKKRRLQESLSRDEKSGMENIFPAKTSIKEKTNIKSSKTDNVTDQNALPTFESSLTKVQNANLQTSTLSNSNILYSEPMKVKLKTSKFVPITDLSAHLNMEGTLNLDHVSTPATSFHINLSTMSPCIEDTQQLIHATFSKPETLNILSKGTEHSFCGSDRADNVSKSEREKTSVCQKGDNLVRINEKQDKHRVLDVSLELLDANFIKMSNENLKTNKSCFLEDITPLVLVPEEFDGSGGEAQSPNQNSCDIKTEREDSQQNISSSDFGDYTLRSQMVLANIEQHLLTYEPITPQMNPDLSKIVKKFKENCCIIKELCKQKVHVSDLEARHKQDLEETLSSVNETVSTDEDLGAPSTLGLIAPKTICERIREAAKRTKKYWEFVKMESDYCYLYTLFGTLPLKVHIHPKLGIVYNVHVYTNLSDLAQPVCSYQLKLLQQKLKQENLLSVLGPKFDIFALLDYIYMSMDEIINFHLEYRHLVKEYGKSHHFRMNPDYSITIEILNLRQIIWWEITVKMSLINMVHVSKDDITAVHKVGKIVSEEHIKTIAENTPKGMKFLQNFITNVDEYVARIGRRVKRENACL